MHTKLQLDYPAILANTARPVHLALTFDAPDLTGARSQPIAFVAVLDRSGSMQGPPLASAKRAAREVARHLRQGDHFGLVVFDDEAQTIIPLADHRDEIALTQAIERIQAGNSTNLAGGWSLGRDLLAEAPAGCPRKLLLLTDGQLNAGIIEPIMITRMVAMALEKTGVRTSCLGLGDGYNEDLLDALAKATGGALHDANQADSLPDIFRKELDGLQSIVVQNLRLRARSGGFVERITVLGDYAELALPNGAKEISVGDLVSGERRVVVLALDVLPIPFGADGLPTANWDGEHLLDLEIRHDLITAEGLVSRTETHHIKVRPVQSPADVQVNAEVLPWVSLQTAAAAVDRALKARDAGDLEGARGIINKELARLAPLPASDLLTDALRLLTATLAALEDGADYVRGKKSIRSMKRFYSMGSTANDSILSEEALPSFKRPRRPAPGGASPASIPAPPSAPSGEADANADAIPPSA